MWRCTNCRCRKCKYCCGEFSDDGGGGSDDDDDDEEEDEEEEGGHARKKHKVTRWRHG